MKIDIYFLLWRTLNLRLQIYKALVAALSVSLSFPNILGFLNKVKKTKEEDPTCMFFNGNFHKGLTSFSSTYVKGKWNELSYQKVHITWWKWQRIRGPKDLKDSWPNKFNPTATRVPNFVKSETWFVRPEWTKISLKLPCIFLCLKCCVTAELGTSIKVM